MVLARMGWGGVDNRVGLGGYVWSVWFRIDAGAVRGLSGEAGLEVLLWGR